jgi:subtilisin family serine protease
MADDLQSLMSAGNDTTVAVIVTGWEPLSGNSADWFSDDGGRSHQSLDGNDFVEQIRERGATPKNIRTFRLLPIIAMEIEASSLSAVKSIGQSIEIYRDEEMRPMLSQSASMINAHVINNAGYTGKGTVVAVIDTGIDTKHPFLAGRTIKEICFASHCPNGEMAMAGPGASYPSPDFPRFEHGTHVAGIAVGASREFSGVAPDAKLIAVNIQNPNGLLGTAAALHALESLYFLKVEEGVPISSINMSFGVLCKNSTLVDYYEFLAQKMRQAGVALIAASGNKGDKHSISSPACAPSVISVGSVGKSLKVTVYSNSSPDLDLLAPGGDQSTGISDGILSSIPNGEYKHDQGTSIAAAQVAGAIAAMRQALPHVSVDQLLDALKKTGRPIKDTNGLTHALIDIAAALKALGVPVQIPDDHHNSPAKPEPKPAPELKPEPEPAPKSVPTKEEEERWQTL